MLKNSIMRTLLSFWGRETLFYRNKFLLFIMLFFLSFIAQAQISGTVYFDGNNDGVRGTAETGYPGITVTAYNSTGAVAGSAVSAGDGTYSIAVAAGSYMVEFTIPNTGLYPAALGSGSNSQVQFANAGQTGVDFGVYQPTDFCGTVSPRMVTSCGLVSGMSVSVASWKYEDRQPVGNATTTPHTEDFNYTDVGIAAAFATRYRDQKVFASTIASPFTSVYPKSPAGIGAIYVLDYSGPGFTKVGSKLLVNLASHINVSNQFPIKAGVLDRFGEQGLAGVELSQDENILYAINMGNGKLVRIDISGVNYASLPSTAPGAGQISEIDIPQSLAAPVSGRFRPSALKKRGKYLYVGGINDASSGTAANLQGVILRYDLAAGTWSKVFTFEPEAWQAGALFTDKKNQEQWGSSNNDPSIQPDVTKRVLEPFFSDIVFDDTDAIIIGITDREVMNPNSAFQTGYVIRTTRNPNGTYTLENAGNCPPFVSSANYSLRLGGCNSYVGPHGPGGNFFFEQSTDQYHIFVFSGGLSIRPGTNELFGGASDPTNKESFGARIWDWRTGASVGGAVLGGQKIVRIVGVDGICEPGWVEIGNLVWQDMNTNGKQDGGDNGIPGVTVQLLNASGAIIATAITDSKGNYVFSSDPLRSSTSSHIYNLTLDAKGTYIVRIINASGASIQTPLAALYPTTENVGANAFDIIDSDGTANGTSRQATVVLGLDGQNNHTIDFGFTATSPCSPTAPVVADGSRCGAGSLAVNVSTACGSGFSLKVFSDAALTTDVTSGFTVSATTLTRSVIGTTTNYYAACQSTTDASCKSTGDMFTLTVNPMPTTTAGAINATCTGPNTNNDGKIILYSFTTEKYGYSLGSTYSGPTSYATATAIPSGGVILSGLASPASPQTYSIRIFNAAGCSIDKTATITPTNCSCPSVAGCTVEDNNRCGIGSLTATISSVCATGSSLKIFTDSGLSADATNLFTISGSSATIASLSSTTTYYAACADDTYPSCKSAGDPFVLTINNIPTQVTATANDGTCTGPSYNNDGKITLANFTTERVDYMEGTVYTGSASYATATAIPANGIIASSLPNPVTSQDYVIRIFTSAGCYNDIVVTLNNAPCVCPYVSAPSVTGSSRCGAGILTASINTSCSAGSTFKIYSNSSLTSDVTSSFSISGSSASISLSSSSTYYAACVDNTYPVCQSAKSTFTLSVYNVPNITATASNVTCTNSVANTNGTIKVTGFTAERYSYTLGTTYTGTATYSTATPIPAGGVITNTLPNPAVSQSYTIKFFNSSGCSSVKTVTLTNTNCAACPPLVAPVVEDATRCGVGSLSTTLTTACTSGSTLKIYSDASLTADVSSLFTVAATTVTKTSATATATYYAACISNTSTYCGSSSDSFVMTVNSNPTTTAAITNATCAGPTSNDNGKITLTTFTTEKYDFNIGGTYTGTADYSTATAIPVGGIITNTLPNPSAAQQYTVRIFNAAGCFVDRVVTLGAVTCTCPTVTAPAIGNATRCGSGSMSATISTACASTANLKIFSEATLTTEVTSSFTLTTTTATMANATATATYYAVCVHKTYPTCKSTADNFVLTVNIAPPTTATATNATCNGPTALSNGTITLSNFTTERYSRSTGATYTGTATYATATAIPANGIIANNLANPATSQVYTIRVFNSTCYVDLQVTLSNSGCVCPPLPAPVIRDTTRCGAGAMTATMSSGCASGSTLKIYSNSTMTTDVTSQFTITANSITKSSVTATVTYYAACVNNTYATCKSSDTFKFTVGTTPTTTATATNATCAGPTSNDNGKITLTTFTTERYDYTLGSTYTGSATYATATPIPTGGVIVNNLPNPTGTSQAYTVRIFSVAGCPIDRTVTLTKVTCACPTVTAPAVSNITRCGPGAASAAITTACASTAALTIYSDAALTTDVTSEFTFTTTAATKTLATATATYYAKCVHKLYPTCKSTTTDSFVITVNAAPPVTATGTNATCNGPTALANGTITLAGFTTERYSRSTGATYTGTATYSTATAIPATGIIASTLANPTVSQTYTVRVFNSLCYVDLPVTLTNANCACPSVAAPDVSDTTRCGTTGAMTATIKTGCSSGSTLKIYSNSALTTDVTSSFTITATTITKASVTATITYYAACVNNTYTTCKVGDAFKFTVSTVPTTTAAITNATCAGPTSNNNGKITLTTFTTERFDISMGSTYTGTKTYATADAIPTTGIITNTLPNPSAAQPYTVRVFNAAGCFVDRVVTLAAVTCACPTVTAPVMGNATRCGSGSLVSTISTACATTASLKIFSDVALTDNITNYFTITSTSATMANATATATYYAACFHKTYPTCKSATETFVFTVNPKPTTIAEATNAVCSGTTATASGKITLSDFTTEKYAYNTGTTYTGTATYATATAIPATGIIASTLANPSVSQSYTIRIFNSLCSIDRTVTLTNTNCNCPVVAAPIIDDAERCATGVVSANISTACVSGSSIKIYSNSSLTTDVTSQFTISGTSVTSPSLSATTTYYAACTDNITPTCKSQGNAFVLTINANPTTTAATVQATCAGPTINSDGSIVLTGFTTERYSYNIGSTYTGTATYATANPIPEDGIIEDALPNPVNAQTYTVRIFNLIGCFIDRVVTLSPRTTACVCPTVVAPAVANGTGCGEGVVYATLTTDCASTAALNIFSDAALTNNITNEFTIGATVGRDMTTTTTYYAACVNNTYPTCKSTGDSFTLTVNNNPTASVAATNVSCTGTTINADGKITITGFGATEKYAYTTSDTYTGTATYATATTIPASGIIASTLANPAIIQDYTVRIFNSSGCYIDETVTLTHINCVCPVLTAPVVEDITRCGTGLASANITTPCDAGASLKIYSNSTLTTEVTSLFTIDANSVDLTNATTTATYYVICVNDENIGCKSASSNFVVTINANPPTGTATATSATCFGPTANKDAKITLTGFTTERYDYNEGSTYLGTDTYATATTIPSGGVIVSNLDDPSVSQVYTIRIFNAIGCYIDKNVTLMPAPCTCPPVTSPVVGDNSRCEAGTLTADINTTCASGTTLNIFSDAALTNEVNSLFTITTTTITIANATVTTTYYAACVHNTYPTCVSVADAFVLTVNNKPTVTAIETNSTCFGATENADGKITLSGFTTEKYAYNAGSTYTGTATYATATAIPANGVIVSNLANPAVSQDYTVRIFNSSGCYTDEVVTLTHSTCLCSPIDAPVIDDVTVCGVGSTAYATILNDCASGSVLKIYSNAALTTDVSNLFTIGASVDLANATTNATYYAACVDAVNPGCKSTGDMFVITINNKPTATASATNATCFGPTANFDGKITVSNFTTERYDFNPGNVYTGSDSYATATAIPTGGVIANTLANPSVSQTYTIRIFNSVDCFVDIPVTLTEVVCVCPPVPAPAVSNANRCNSGAIFANIATPCTAGASLRVFSDASLTNDISSSFLIGVSTVGLANATTTTTYYTICQHDAFPTCKSGADSFELTINSDPTTSAVATNATCTGASLNTDGKITLSGFTTEHYAYNLGDSYTGSATYATATAIPANGVIVSNLASPSVSQDYTVRIFNSSGCFIDRVVTLTVTSCVCPSIAAPVVGDNSRCESGLLAVTINTVCASGSTLKIFSDVSLSTDITNLFSISASTINLANAVSTTTYYAACVDNTSPSCKSVGDSFTMTINSNPTATASASNATCSGVTLNVDGKITLSGFTTERYDYTTGSTYTGSGSYATATAIPVNGVIVSNLPSPSVSQSYTVRIFNSSGCFIDRVVTLTATNCNCPLVAAPTVSDVSRCESGSIAANVTTACATGSSLHIYSDVSLTTDVSSQFTIGSTVSKASLSTTTTYYAACVDNTSPSCKSAGDSFTMTINSNPTATASASNATCSGVTINVDGKITLSGFTTERYDYTTGSTYTGSSSYATATAIPVNGVIVSNLASPAVSQDYTVRIFNSSGCFVDRVVTLAATNCNCPKPDAGSDVAICLPKTTLDLADAISGTTWIAVAGNPANAIINATTGEITGMTLSGTYKFKLQNSADVSCFDEMQVIVSPANVTMLCSDGSTSYTIIAQSGTTNVVWYNMSGTQVGTGATLVVNANTLGMSDGSEAYYYLAKDSNSCDTALCCPLQFMLVNCCPTPNCKSVTVIKKSK